MKDDRIYLRHILECVDAIQSYTAETQELFFRDRKTLKATLRQLQELAESTQRLSQSLKDRHPEIPWRAIAGFRNVLVHDYLGLSLSRVWDIIERDLPSLRVVADTVLSELRRTYT
ncbi:MAG: DUF86 domain-containing protein [Desulforhabdus sp.]|jgi:uncharacterized protein with HEPN domain|nr:DUF86 domain-containing protein [Desulforhabdus sp.]